MPRARDLMSCKTRPISAVSASVTVLEFFSLVGTPMESSSLFSPSEKQISLFIKLVIKKGICQFHCFTFIFLIKFVNTLIGPDLTLGYRIKGT